MIFKRPSFKRGGKPTGIESLTPRTKLQFGTPQFNFLDPSIQKQLRMEAELKNKNLRTSNLRTPSGGLSKGTRGTRFLTQLRNFGIPSLSTTAGTLAIPVATTGALAYMNRPKTLAEKRFMQNFGALDETMSEDDLAAYFAERDRLSKQGDEISFTDAIFMDPDTKTYPSMFGRTEDRNKIIEAAKKKKEAQEREEADLSGIGEGKSAEVLPGETALDAVLREGKVIAEKRAEKQEVPNSKDTDPGGQTVETSFESEFEKQKNRLEKYLGANKDEDKAMISLALADAIGTPGNIADKAKILNNKLVGIGLSKKKDRKEIAKLAFAAATEIEKTKIAAGKQGFQERLFNEYIRLDSKKNRTPKEEKRLSQLKGGLNIKTGLTGPTAKAAGVIAENVRDSISSLTNAPEADKADILAEIIGGVNQLLLLEGIDKSNISSVVGFDVSPYFEKAEGGRVMKATGDMASETPTEPVATKLTFEQLRTRLPKEITDDIVRLVATSEEALQDFSYIRTQGDVEKFNVKYGVNLVLPQDTA